MDAIADINLDARPLWVREKGAAEFFGLKRASLLKLVASGSVKAKRVGGCVVFRFADIADAIERAEDYR